MMHATQESPGPCAAVALAAVFEVVDCTNEETYFTLGVFPSREEAIAACAVDNPSNLGCHDHDGWEDRVVIEIRERVLGWSGFGKPVHRITWSFSYDATDEKLWSRRETPL